MSWSLRRVQVLQKVHPHWRKPKVYEVYLDEVGRPWTYSDAHLVDIIRFVRDWRKTPVLRFPNDFDGEPAFLKELAEMQKREGWHSLTYEEIEEMRRREAPTIFERIWDWLRIDEWLGRK